MKKNECEEYRMTNVEEKKEKKMSKIITVHVICAFSETLPLVVCSIRQVKQLTTWHLLFSLEFYHKSLTVPSKTQLCV